MEKAFLYNKLTNGHPTLFLYQDNVLPDELILDTIKWLEKKKFKSGQSIDGREIPRKQIWYHMEKEYFCNTWKYKYDRWQSEEYDLKLLKLQNYIQEKVKEILEDYQQISVPKINSCLVNEYRDGSDIIKPHSDTAISFGEFPTIVNLSIGDTREFLIKKKGKKDIYSLNLKNNSLLIMAGGSQKYFTHEVPESDSKNKRYSFTFRQHLNSIK